MVNKNLAGRCGLYCGFCEIYRAYKDSKELQQELAKKHSCSPDEVRCEGCQALNVYAWSYEKEWGTNCKFVKCLNAKKLNFCFECAEYETCEKFDKFVKICAGIGVDLRHNLTMIKEEVEEWIMTQDTKWRCPRCGRPIIVSYSFKNCHMCGYRLRE